MTTEFGGERRSKRARIMGDNDEVDARAHMLHEEVDVEAARPPYIHVRITRRGAILGPSEGWICKQ